MLEQDDKPRRLPKSERFVCFRCQAVKPDCLECQGTGYISAEHGLVRLIEDVLDRRQLLST
jgi:hypothetical protein